LVRDRRLLAAVQFCPGALVTSAADTIDVIVRFHDVGKLSELDRCVFSLLGQRYRPLHIYLVTQRFTAEAILQTRSALEPLLAIEDAPALTLINWTNAVPADARSMLINLALDAVQGRYLAFLDYDDVLYPDAYELLISRLSGSGAAIAFGGISVKVANRFADFLYVKSKQLPFSGNGLADLFRRNFCPIHSFVIDRSRIQRQFLSFDPTLTHGEDYDFLLRVCALFEADFGAIYNTIGDYYYKTDGSNTINTDWDWSQVTNGEWLKAEDFLEQRRRITQVAPAVQRKLGLAPVAGLTIADLLKKVGPTATRAD
jgi:hypothetical protein